MKRLIALLVTISPAALADTPLFKVDVGVEIFYGDGTQISITTDKVINLEGFTCSVERVSRAKSLFHFGPSFACQIPDSDSYVYMAARCDARIPGDKSSNAFSLKGPKSPDFDVLTQVQIACETSYTRAIPTHPPKTEKM